MAKSSAGRRADRLAVLHRELAGLIRAARNQRQEDLFYPATGGEIKSCEAQTAPRTVTLSLRETFDLFRAALPATARDVTTRKSHALLLISIRHFLDTLHAIEHDVPSPASIAAGELVAREVRTWLRRAQRSVAKDIERRVVWAARVEANYAAPSPKRAARKRTVSQQPSLLLPVVNIIAIPRHDSSPFRNSDPFRSKEAADVKSSPLDLVEPQSGEMTVSPVSKRTA